MSRAHMVVLSGLDSLTQIENVEVNGSDSPVSEENYEVRGEPVQTTSNLDRSSL